MKQGKYRAYIADGILVDAFEFRPQQALVVDFSGRITAIESPQELDPEIEVVDCSGSIFVAAPILAHSHLESFDAPCDDFDNSGFAQWVRSLLQWRESENRLSPQQSAAKSLELLSENGCGLVATHVAETGAEGDVESVLPEVQAFVEVFNPHSDIPQFEEFPFRGIALHAPYSVHDDIARHVFSMATDDDVISIHLGEHSQEREFLRNGEGELARLFMERQLPLKS
ncbi:MAG: hypothetical protein QGF46_06035, partial [Planctomycetota bacterium]|nr:hypothetical protein [Planctomycetota bacterium]